MTSGPTSGPWLDTLQSSMTRDNPIFSAGFGLMVVGFGLNVARKSSVYASQLARRRLLVSLEITAQDSSHEWFLQWMSHQIAQSRARAAAAAEQVKSGKGKSWLASWRDKFEGFSIPSHELAVETKIEKRLDGSAASDISIVPGQGVHYFQYKHAWFQMRRERDGKMVDLSTGTPWETLKITTLSRDRHLFRELLSDAQELARAQKRGKTVIYSAWGNEWRPFGRPRDKRPIGSVVLDEGVKERILDDLETFMSRGQWYEERGIPYRRGYLLYGPPGSGKSSFVQSVAGHLDFSICVLNLSERSLTDDRLNLLLANAPERSFILLEDVDSAFNKRNKVDDAGFVSNVTFSGLLNALDGVASSTAQRVLFMTTNHLDRLDPALVRPGRVDLRILLDDATPYQAHTLYTKFYTGSVDNLEDAARRFMQAYHRNRELGRSISMAALQNLFIRSSADEAIDRLDEAMAEARAETKKVFASGAF